MLTHWGDVLCITACGQVRAEVTDVSRIDREGVVYLPTPHDGRAVQRVSSRRADQKHVGGPLGAGVW